MIVVKTVIVLFSRRNRVRRFQETIKTQLDLLGRQRILDDPGE